MDDDPQLAVKVSPQSAAALAGATVTWGTLNAVVACFLAGDPFGVGVDEVAKELVGVRNAGLVAMAMAEEVSEAKGQVDLDRVAKAAAETAGGAVSLAFRWLEVVRRRGELGPLAEAEVERMEGILLGIAELLPAMPRVSDR